MQLIEKEQALTLLQNSMREFKDYLSHIHTGYWKAWGRNVKVRVETIFGSDSNQAVEIDYLLSEFWQEDSYSWMSDKAHPIYSLLLSFYTEVDELWAEESLQPRKQKDIKTPEKFIDPDNKRVFIVHGHDHGRMQAVARFIEQLGLEAVILHERANIGDTIIEKLERHSEAIYAIVLLTPDDVGSKSIDRDRLLPRARQNVILELGYFLAKLGRIRTAALVVEGVEIPSDYSGILYISLDNGDEWKLILAREMKASGINIDMNKVV